MIASTGLVILVLFITSFIVRVIPAFLGVHLGESVRSLVERVLPAAVFLNFAVYIFVSEVRAAPLPAILSIAAVGAMSFLTRAGLILTASIGSFIYVLLILAMRP